MENTRKKIQQSKITQQTFFLLMSLLARLELTITSYINIEHFIIS